MADYWTPKDSVRNLPRNIIKSYRNEARRLYDDLIRRKLTIGTAPLNDNGYGRVQKRRVVEQTNPSWYSKFYNSFKKRTKKKGYTKGNPRKKRGNGVHTFCERKRVENALFRIISGEDSRLSAPRNKSGPSNLYQTLMRELIHDNLVNGCYDPEDENGLEPDNCVREFFGLRPVDSEEFWISQGFEVAKDNGEVPF